MKGVQCTSIWTALHALYRFLSNLTYLFWLDVSLNITGLITLILILNFVMVYPYRVYIFSETQRILLSLSILAFSLLVVFSPFFILRIERVDGWTKTQYGTFEYSLFGVALLALMVASISILLWKRRGATGDMKWRLDMITLGVAFSFIIGLIVDIVLTFFGGAYLYWHWLGPVSSLAMNVIVFRILYNRG